MWHWFTSIKHLFYLVALLKCVFPFFFKMFLLLSTFVLLYYLCFFIICTSLLFVLLRYLYFFIICTSSLLFVLPSSLFVLLYFSLLFTLLYFTLLYFTLLYFTLFYFTFLYFLPSLPPMTIVTLKDLQDHANNNDDDTNNTEKYALAGGKNTGTLVGRQQPTKSAHSKRTQASPEAAGKSTRRPVVSFAANFPPPSP